MGSIRMYDMGLPQLRQLAVDTLTMREEAETREDRIRLNATLEEIVSQYATDSKTACYRAAVASGDPMAYACIESFYPAIRVKETKDKEAGTVTYSIEDTEKSIDLKNLHDKVKGGIGKDHMWVALIQAFNFKLTVRAANRQGDGTLEALLKSQPDCYRLNDEAKTIKTDGPLTEEDLIVEIDKILKAMIGPEYEADIHDVAHIVDCYISPNRKSKTNVNAANHRTLIEFFKKVCHRHLTGATGYGVDSREVKR